MDRIHLMFDYSPVLIPLCVFLGLFYAYLLYRKKAVWSRRVNIALFITRASLVTLMAFLLIGPTLRLTHVEKEKPALVFLIDNSTSVREAVDAVAWDTFYRQLQTARQQIEKQGFSTPLKMLDNQSAEREAIRFVHPSSDINGTAKRIIEDYDGKNLVGVVVVSDGIYNSGFSPLYSPTKVPIYTVGIGDTLQHIDISIKQVLYNKIAHQGNRFPVHVEVLIQGTTNQEMVLSLYQKGQLIAQQKKNTASKSLLQFDFEVDAKEQGLQRIEVVATPWPNEQNIKNNRTDIYVDVVEGKKKVLIISSNPHPDDKVLGAVIEETTNYDMEVYRPSVRSIASLWKGKEKPDLVIFRYASNNKKTLNLLEKINKEKIPVFIMLGGNINPQLWKKSNIPVSFARTVKKKNTYPAVNLQYKNFTLPDKVKTIFRKYPPADLPFKNIKYPPNTSILLYQNTIGTKKKEPLLFSFYDNDRAVAVLMGENIWKWRMNEFAESRSTEGFDRLFSKLIQYLGIQENKQRFRSFPLQKEFTTAEPVVFESQVYNPLFELIYGNSILLEITDEQNKTRSYRYVVGPGRSRYALGELQEGIYQYRSSTVLDKKNKTVTGTFRVTSQRIESQNLTADFALLKAWADRTGGQFYNAADITQLASDFKNQKPQIQLNTEASFNPFIDLKWVFVLLLLLISAEWFTRKFLGDY